MKAYTLQRTLFVLSLLLALVAPLTAPPTGYAEQPLQQRSRGAQRPAPQPTPAATPQSAGTATATAQRPQPAVAEPFIRRTLANGLEVVVIEDHSVPLVTIELAVRNGSFTETPEYNGLSHLYEHMFFKANRAIANQEEYLRQIGQLGIAYNGTTREEVVNYYFSTTSPNLPTAMRLMRDAARYPLFNEREFERERQVVIGEIDRAESNPYYYLNREMNTRLFARHPSRKNPLGSRQTVLAATTDMMRTIQQRYYIPNNSALLVAGDVEPDAIFRMAQELFGDWERGEDPFQRFPLAEHPPLQRSEGAVIEQPIQNVIINIGWHGPSIGQDNEATYAADVFSFILRQPDSRFQRALVDTGLVTGVDFIYYTQRNVGPIQLIAQTTPDRAREAVRAIYAEIARFNEPDYFTDEQLESAKALLEADDLYSREKLSDYIHTVGFWWSSTGLDYFRNYLADLRRTSRADIRRYVSTYIQNKPHVSLALMSSEAQRQVRLTPEELIGR